MGFSTGARVLETREALKERGKIACKSFNRAYGGKKKSATTKFNSCIKNVSDKKVSKRYLELLKTNAIYVNDFEGLARSLLPLTQPEKGSNFTINLSCLFFGDKVLT